MYKICKNLQKFAKTAKRINHMNGANTVVRNCQNSVNGVENKVAADNYSNITCVYPEEEIAEVATAPETELKVESSPGGAEPGTPPPPGGGGPGIPPAPGGGGPGTPTAPGGGGPGTVPPPGGPVAPPPIHQS